MIKRNKLVIFCYGVCLFRIEFVVFASGLFIKINGK